MNPGNTTMSIPPKVAGGRLPGGRSAASMVLPSLGGVCFSGVKNRFLPNHSEFSPRSKVSRSRSETDQAWQSLNWSLRGDSNS